jgi:hypothetical protein
MEMDRQDSSREGKACFNTQYSPFHLRHHCIPVCCGSRTHDVLETAQPGEEGCELMLSIDLFDIKSILP